MLDDYQFGDELPVHNHGYVILHEIMGSDEVIVDSARLSYDRRGKSEDRGLIRYLLRHRHTSPFEMGVMRFEVKMPIFVARQWIRHRTASLNEMSARYTELPNEMFVPEVVALQATDNKQGRGVDAEERAQAFLKTSIDTAHSAAYTTYESLLRRGVARELARGVLPVNIYTKFIWKMDLHNLMHFMDLRLDKHAQQEIRDYAEPIEELMALYFPITHEAFVDYIRDAYTCSRMEVEALQYLLRHYRQAMPGSALKDADGIVHSLDTDIIERGMNKREFKEFTERFF